MIYLERTAEGPAEGALVLLHGRGSSEHDLYPLLDAFDPERRLDGYTLRAPMAPPGQGFHWYVVPRVGYPDPASFNASYAEAGAWLDALPHEKIILGGFSQGAVMSYALGLGSDRKRATAVIGLSGFVPVVPGWDIAAPFPPIFLAHGTYDSIIPLSFAHASRDRLEAAGATLDYRESPMDHQIDPRVVQELPGWIRGVLSAAD